MKKIECRSWKTDYRGDLLICASSSLWWAGTICKNALCIVTLAGIVSFTEEHLQLACMDEMPEGDHYAWILEDLWFVEPFEVKGKLHLYDVDDSLITLQGPDESCQAFAERCYKSLVKWEDKYATRAEIEDPWEGWMGFLAQVDEQAAQ